MSSTLSIIKLTGWRLSNDLKGVFLKSFPGTSPADSYLYLLSLISELLTHALHDG